MWRLVAAPAVVLALALTAAPAHAADRATTVLRLINTERAAHGLRALHADARLARAARGHSAEMVRERYFDHDSRSGAAFTKRIAATGWMRGRRAYKVGENLAWGTGQLSEPAAVVAAWMASPAHRETLLDPAYGVAGVGAARGTPTAGDDGETYTVDFGSLRSRAR
jgi:uncharacterized protein YkwD